MNGWKTKMRYAPFSVRKQERIAFFVAALVFVLISNAKFASADFNFTVATSTVSISICNNGIVDSGETCDFGLGFNDGAYSSTTAGRHCATNCRSWGPYCGDGILKAFYGEECVPDGNNFCTDQCKQKEAPISSSTPPAPPPTPSGNGGGSGAVPMRAQTQVVFAGKAYPNTRVQILKDGQLQGIAQADGNADFSYNVANATPGPTTFGFWAEDNKKIRSITYTTTFQVTQNAVTNVGNVFLPPTIRALLPKVAPGSDIVLDGTTAPRSHVQLLTDKSSAPALMATSKDNGEWGANLPTTGMTPETYHQILPYLELITASGTVPQKSGNGAALNIFVGNNDVSAKTSNGDINGDGKVNMIDFSMLLFRFGSGGPVGDLNHDGKVNIADLSIMLFNWTS